MSKYFNITEFTKSSTAQKHGIKNIPSLEELKNIDNLITYILDPLREAYGKPIIINSGYRCLELNKLIKGSKTSQHLTGQAADIRSVKNTKEENKKLYDLIIQLKLPFDQLINEYDFSWVHVSFSERNRRQILAIK